MASKSLKQRNAELSEELETTKARTSHLEELDQEQYLIIQALRRLIWIMGIMLVASGGLSIYLLVR